MIASASRDRARVVHLPVTRASGLIASGAVKACIVFMWMTSDHGG